MKKLDALLRPYLEEKDAETPFRLVEMWRRWPEVVGADIAELVKPVGRRGTTLLLVVEDSLVMQEMSYYAPALLEQVNAALGMPFFEKVQFELKNTQVCLDRPQKSRQKSRLPLKRPKRLGGLTDAFDPDSPVAAGYKQYLRMFAAQDEHEDGEDKGEDTARLQGDT